MTKGAQPHSATNARTQPSCARKWPTFSVYTRDLLFGGVSAVRHIAAMCNKHDGLRIIPLNQVNFRPFLRMCYGRRAANAEQCESQRYLKLFNKAITIKYTLFYGQDCMRMHMVVVLVAFHSSHRDTDGRVSADAGKQLNAAQLCGFRELFRRNEKLHNYFLVVLSPSTLTGREAGKRAGWPPNGDG